MKTTISQRELRNDSGSIMRRVESGEAFTVTRNGTAIADLVPHDSTAVAPARFVPVDVIARGAAGLPDWGVDRFAEDLRELDDAVDDSDIDRWHVST